MKDRPRGRRVGLSLVWHQHQPLYRDLGRTSPGGSYRMPWVRLHALRDYYGMAALVSRFPGVHLTINFSACLLWQIEDYAERGATDEALELTLIPVESLDDVQRETLLSTFFEADWHRQIFPHPRYGELFAARKDGRSFSPQDLRDLQMWFNLAWFAKEFRDGETTLVTGETVSVARFVDQQRGFTEANIREMVDNQLKILRAILPLHRRLQDDGQIEISVTPFFHPILPLLIDSDQATVDRPAATLPRRFRHPEDADAQVAAAVENYVRWFGRPPRGAWPAEGAVSQASVSFFARRGLRWIASDQGVLARSGRWGYRVDDPTVKYRPYRAEEGADAVTILFRDTELSDDIGFRCQSRLDVQAAVRQWVEKVKSRASTAPPGTDCLVTVVLDGENAWSAYADDGRPFLCALYAALERDEVLCPVTPSEFLDEPGRVLPKVYDLFTGSWIDEASSAPGVDLGTWIGEWEENRAWELLGGTRDFLSSVTASPEDAPRAFQALYAAEGSDWFWWYGTDQESGRDPEFDALFRSHLASVYSSMGRMPPASLHEHIVPREIVWSFARSISSLQVGDRLTVRVNCPGVLIWSADAGEPDEAALQRVGGVMAGLGRYQITLGPFLNPCRLQFSFRCTHPGCDCADACCSTASHAVSVVSSGT